MPPLLAPLPTSHHPFCLHILHKAPHYTKHYIYVHLIKKINENSCDQIHKYHNPNSLLLYPHTRYYNKV